MFCKTMFSSHCQCMDVLHITEEREETIDMYGKRESGEQMKEACIHSHMHTEKKWTKKIKGLEETPRP